MLRNEYLIFLDQLNQVAFHELLTLVVHGHLDSHVKVECFQFVNFDWCQYTITSSSQRTTKLNINGIRIELSNCVNLILRNFLVVGIIDTIDQNRQRFARKWLKSCSLAQEFV